MKNKCINCDYFISCKRNDKNEQKVNCEYFKRTLLQSFIKNMK